MYFFVWVVYYNQCQHSTALVDSYSPAAREEVVLRGGSTTTA